MRDVARRAGVSHQTVSRVLNDASAVRTDTRDRVLSAIEELGYRRNSAARALVTRRSRTFGVITMPATLYGPASTLHAIELAAQEAGYFVRVATVSSFERHALSEALRWLEDGPVEGLVVLAPLLGAAAELRGLWDDVPVVFVEGATSSGVASVSVDQVAGAGDVTRHLLERSGREPVWHVAGPTDWVEAQQRVIGWSAAHAEAGIDPPAPLPGTWSPSSGYAAGLSLARRRDVRAVFVANDRMALGLLRAFSESGVRVPDDVLVAGYDDVPEAAFYSPPLTSVRQDFAGVGRHSIGSLVRQLEGPGTTAAAAVLPPTLVVRQSSEATPRPRRRATVAVPGTGRRLVLPEQVSPAGRAPDGHDLATPP
ncbi:LacI family DNA-binding transcriptional regulator [Motilibacter aurantiacus]|uniref:LacI family DNA-binding transcriptional regulator n=1 Tax=Motilibacter aurantiacus TaxID=2714955 RepID=UPI0014089574|nr:LacI family DNA-binding transcriptional regulator [Motilibacter aurantiacus]NHC47450.1 LacI family DNA-binding transcriptional regulator [Motilibacter aurantiacus]